jgi:DNA-binding NarL/FixJ family response regulator
VQLAPDARLAVYRTAQEGLANARKHASGAAVEVRLTWREDGAALEVVDDGGLPHHDLQPSGAGAGLADSRSEQLGRGSLRTRAAPTASGWNSACPRNAPTRSIMTVRVLVVDDQRTVREGLTRCSTSSPTSSWSALPRTAPVPWSWSVNGGLTWSSWDLRMPGMDGVEATARIRATDPQVAVVVLTTHADDESVFSALRAGARGYLTKDAGIAEITRALTVVHDGQALLEPSVQARLLEVVERGPVGLPVTRPAELTEREVEVLRLIADGLSNAEIAELLVVSEATVKTHVNHLFAKTGVRDRAQAVAYAFRTGHGHPLGRHSRRSHGPSARM